MKCDVVPASKAAEAAAKKVALDLGLSLADSFSTARAPVALVVDVHEVWLQSLATPRPGRVMIVFSSPDMVHRRKAGHNEPLGRAVGLKADRKPRVFDATAGLGRDAFVLADLGCRVELSEVSPVLHFLLVQAHKSALMSASDKVTRAAERMVLSCGDSISRTLSDIDVIYLDPMFPERGKSAAVKKDLATVQALHSDAPIAESGDRLLDWALSQSVSRVVLKRPAKSPNLGGVKPSHTLSGKTVRFDVFVRPCAGEVR